MTDDIFFYFYSIIGEDRPISSKETKSKPFCQKFKGSACSTHISNKHIYVTSRFEQGLREEKVIGKYSEVFQIRPPWELSKSGLNSDLHKKNLFETEVVDFNSKTF